MKGQHAKSTTPRIDKKFVMLCAPALLPLIFMIPAIITFNTVVLNKSGNNVLGAGGELLFLGTLGISSAALLTRRRSFSPSLRRWYGIMFAVTIIIGTIIDAIGNVFAGGVIGQLTGHAFLITGTIMTALAIPLLATSTRVSQKQLGKYWRPFQRYGTYAIWGVLFIHMAFLDGFGVGVRGIAHQSLYQLTAISLPLIILRVPAVQRWVKRRQRAGQRVWAAVTPLVVVALVGCVLLVNEELHTGVSAFMLNS